VQSANPIKFVPLTEQEFEASRIGIGASIRNTIIGHLLFISAISGMARLFTNIKYGRILDRDMTYAEYLSIKDTPFDKTSDPASFYFVILILFAITFVALAFNLALTILPRYKDGKAGEKIIELAQVVDVTTTPVSYVVHTNSPLFPSINTETSDSRVPQIGQQIILGYYKYTHRFIGYYWE
jgi:hypothetical protein